MQLSVFLCLHAHLFCSLNAGLWDSLIYEDGRKMQLIAYANAAMQFSAKAVDPALISWNRVVLIHGMHVTTSRQ